MYFLTSLSLCSTGFYQYIEASNRRRGDVAILRSRNTVIPEEKEPWCFVLFYHMYGSDTGQLRIVREDESGRTELFSASGEKMWRHKVTNRSIFDPKKCKM